MDIFWNITLKPFQCLELVYTYFVFRPAFVCIEHFYDWVKPLQFFFLYVWNSKFILKTKTSKLKDISVKHFFIILRYLSTTFILSSNVSYNGKRFVSKYVLLSFPNNITRQKQEKTKQNLRVSGHHYKMFIHRPTDPSKNKTYCPLRVFPSVTCFIYISTNLYM